ncbi:hypothetical protein N9F16_00805 [bacterium]|nr:hypothetical protein [bacterium]|tara:strand:+ start:22 stop:558 length:537 start_codon:yes stop_codon:yes gene_type:complete
MIIQQPTITASISGDNIKTNPNGAYIGFAATSSHPTASNELVFGLGTIGLGNNTATIGNNSTDRVYLKGSIYGHQNLIGDNTITHNLEKFYVYTLSGSFTASLPTSPNEGDSIKISNFSTSETGSDRGAVDPVESKILIGRNGENIMGLPQDMGLNQYAPSFELIYTESTKGWIIISS